MANKSRTVLKRNQLDVPMVTTDFYKWLGDNYTGFLGADRLKYLESKYQFVAGRDSIDTEVVDALRHIHQHYFYNVELGELRK